RFRFRPVRRPHRRFHSAPGFPTRTSERAAGCRKSCRCISYRRETQITDVKLRLPANMRPRTVLPKVLAIVLCVLFSFETRAQSANQVLTADDYARAERLLGSFTRDLVSGDAVRPNWLTDDRMWYRNTINGGAEFILVNPAT